MANQRCGVDTKNGDMAHPLHWPAGRPRTPRNKRREGAFKLTLASSIEDMIDELRLMKARYVTISSDMRGYYSAGVWRPYASEARVDDPGVAVYFDLDGEQICMACDRWNLVSDNVRALGLTIGAMRGIKRWGSTETMKMAFAGFRHALPAAGDDWRSVFEMNGKKVGLDAVKKKHRELARQAHPDRGGNQHQMVRLNQALDAAKGELDG